MEPITVIAVYKARGESEAKLDETLATHFEVLSKEGLTTYKSPTYLKAADGVRLEIVEWKSEQAANDAHTNPRVQAIWERLATLSEFKTLGDLDNAKQPFPHFAGNDLKRCPRTLTDTIIKARDREKLRGFYQQFASLKVMEQSEHFDMLVDPRGGQTLCVADGPDIDHAGLSISVEDVPQALEDLKGLGGKVVETWEYKTIRGANAKDPEGNDLVVFQMLS